MDRREFFKHTAVAGAGSFLLGGAPASARSLRQPRRMKRSASRASASAARETATPTTPAEHGEIVALCDIDSEVLDKMGKKYPKAKKYFDYRKMLEELGDKIDAVTVSTPDHTHAPASVMAMRMGKHCFCQKPLTWSVEEARLMRTLAAEKKLCTQMGNQGTAENGFRAGRRADPIGHSRDRSRRSMSGPIARSGRRASAGPRTRPGIPNHVRWYEFLGSAHDRPYHPDYQPFNWRGWLDFGTGALGDMACHTINIAAWRSSCSTPSRSRSSTPRASSTTKATRSGRSSAPGSARATDAAPLTLTWFDGGDKLPEDKRTYKEHLHGEKAPGQRAALGRREGLVLLRERLRRRAHPAAQGQVQGGRQARSRPCRARRATSRNGSTPSRPAIRSKAMSNFDYAGRLTETVLLGVVALKAGTTIEWDPVAHEGQERPLRRPVHPARLSQGLLDPRLNLNEQGLNQGDPAWPGRGWPGRARRGRGRSRS